MSDITPTTKRKQTRRSVSLSRASYDGLKEYVDRNNRSMSGVLEEILNKFLDVKPSKKDVVEAVVEPPKVKKTMFSKGDRVNYHAVIGGPVTILGAVIMASYIDYVGEDKEKKRVTYRIKGVLGMIASEALSEM